MSMTIHLFAGLRDLLDAESIVLEPTASPLTTAQLKQEISAKYPRAAHLIKTCFVAKNQAYAPDSEMLDEHDEIALIPPVSGGQDLESQAAVLSDEPLFLISAEPIDVDRTVRKVLDADHGATLAFIGTTREYTMGKRTVYLEYSAYEPMALKTMAQIQEEMQQKWPGVRCAITHRIGKVEIGEISVVIALSAPHRAACYEASRHAIERLKTIVPIWKKEIWEDGTEWKGDQTGSWKPL